MKTKVNTKLYIQLVMTIKIDVKQYTAPKDSKFRFNTNASFTKYTIKINPSIMNYMKSISNLLISKEALTSLNINSIAKIMRMAKQIITANNTQRKMSRRLYMFGLIASLGIFNVLFSGKFNSNGECRIYFRTNLTIA